MIRNIPKIVLFLPSLVGVVLLGAGFGWELAGLVERLSGLAIGYISAAIGGVICALGLFVWFALHIWDLFSFVTNKPARPNAVVAGQKEK